MVFKGAIFDLDGTLANTLGDLRTAMNGMLREFGYPLITPEQTLQNINYGAKMFVTKSLPKEVQSDENTVNKAYAIYEKYYDIHHLDSTCPYGDAVNQVKILKDNGYKLAVLSNKQHKYTVSIVDKLFGRDMFDVVLGHDSTGKQAPVFPHKPDPSSCNYVAERLGLDNSDIAYIGDSHIDMQTAKNAGMESFGVTWGFRQPDFLVENGARHIIPSPEKIAETIINSSIAR